LRLRELPGISALFADFVEGVPGVRRFFSGAPDVVNLRLRAAEAQNRELPREELCNRLLKQAEWFGSSERSNANIERLRFPKTVAVVASLRPGLFGGTLDGWLKICTAARLAAWLEDGGIPAVPLGWIDSTAAAAERSVLLLGSAGPRRVELGSTPGTVIEISGEIESLLGQIAGTLGLVAAETDLLTLLKSAYSPGTDLTRGFGRTLARLMEVTGLILFDPSQPGCEPFAPGLPPHVGDGTLEEACEQQEKLLRDAGYAPAVAEQGSAITGDGRSTSTNVRKPGPFYRQNLIMPVAATVVDELEIFHCALDQPFFSALCLESPVVWPRVSGTILDPRSRKVLAHYGLQLRRLFAGSEAAAAGLGQRLAVSDVPSRLRSLRADLDRQLGDIAAPVASTDRLRARIENSRRRMSYQVEKLEIRFLAARQRRENAILRQVSRLCDSLAPRGRLQEREYAGIHFVLRHSLRLPQILYESIDPWKFTHQLISVD
jgi:uncharacterized protein YllA (UPF0747 family)